MRPTKFDFQINLRTANALGLTLLAEAGEVIEYDAIYWHESASGPSATRVPDPMSGLCKSGGADGSRNSTTSSRLVRFGAHL
jgi:hypothetical protein